MAQPVDTRTAEGEDFLRWLNVFSEFETNATRERQREGVHTAKAKGTYKGRPRTIDADAITRLRDKGLGPSEIAKQLKISRASVYRLAPRRLPNSDAEGSGPQQPRLDTRLARRLRLSGILGEPKARIAERKSPKDDT